MKERYEALELNIVKIPVEDTIMMKRCGDRAGRSDGSRVQGGRTLRVKASVKKSEK